MKADNEHKIPPWRGYVKLDSDGREYLELEGAALFLGLRPKSLQDRIARNVAPKKYKRNGRNYFYVSDLRAYEKATTEIKDTNWYLLKKTA